MPDRPRRACQWRAARVLRRTPPGGPGTVVSASLPGASRRALTAAVHRVGAASVARQRPARPVRGEAVDPPSLRRLNTPVLESLLNDPSHIAFRQLQYCAPTDVNGELL